MMILPISSDHVLRKYPNNSYLCIIIINFKIILFEFICAALCLVLKYCIIIMNLYALHNVLYRKIVLTKCNIF